MQQPFQTPEEFDDDVDVFPEPPAPRLNADQLAERSALEVFPGGTGDLDSDEWWQSTEEAAGSDQQPEPIEFTAQPERPSEASSADWIASSRDTSTARDEAPEEQITPLWAPVEPEPDDATIEVEAEIETEAPAVAEAPLEEVPDLELPFEASWPEAPAPTPADAVQRGAMSMPLLSGREQRVASGASQRAAILAQAGVTDFEETDDSIPNAEAFPESQRKHAAASQAAKQPKQAKKASGRSRVRTIVLSLLVIALGIAALSGGAVATGQGSEVERVTSSLAPDVVEDWISDNISSFGGASTAPEESPTTPSTTDIDQPAVTSLNGVIAHTGGNGIPVRSACVPEARTPRAIPEGQPITVIANGVGDCSGWQVVRAGATVSWVEGAYVEPLP